MIAGRKPSRATIRKAYRDGIRQWFGCGDDDLDRHLIRALKEDVFLAGKDPGGWSSKDQVLSIYCENGIPNATDIHYTPYGTLWHSEKWCSIDRYVNLLLQGLGYSERIHHEPVNNAVVNVYWDW